MIQLFLISFVIIINISPPTYVEEFHNLKNKKDEFNFIKKYNKVNNPSVKAYVVAIEMKKAEYSLNPLTKLSIFNENKNKLNLLIDKNKNNIDLRYIRLLLQEKTPNILNYNKHINEDKLFLKDKLNVKDSSDFLDFYILNNTSL